MVRQYRIHTDLDGSENKIYDMTNGLIRFYQPSDLGIINSTNIWQSQGIGVMGNNNISHPDIDFKFETFGNSLEENYRIFNEFINSIIKQKYITLEYTNEIGTFYADIQLSKITKTEGYGFDGQFSETISFIPVNMWYVYEQLKFSKVQNGEIGGNTKIYGNKETTVYPNLNLLDGTSDKPSTKTGGAWNVSIIGVYKTPEVGQEYTVSVEVPEADHNVLLEVHRLNDAEERVDELNNTVMKSGDSANVTFTWPDPGNSGATHFSATLAWTNDTDTGSYSYYKGKLEPGSTATPYMPSSSEVQPSDYRNYGSYKYDYTYFGEDNIERFSKWKIDDGIFSFTARMTPSQNVKNMSDYGVRFLDEQFNEYTALIFGNTTKPDSIQFNTDINDEYYQAQIGTSTINMFSALNYQRFRTRLIQKGTMELVNVDVVEMNVKRKVEFV